ncbi:hypothetical protein F5Y15DRAFT_418531 [Xylariaceae sp. FL0016]|nr:hypothetical protein F5Y15DRAFT_418531 [Xylariaceae sp. FL0016]
MAPKKDKDKDKDKKDKKSGEANSSSQRAGSGPGRIHTYGDPNLPKGSTARGRVNKSGQFECQERGCRSLLKNDPKAISSHVSRMHRPGSYYLNGRTKPSKGYCRCGTCGTQALNLNSMRSHMNKRHGLEGKGSRARVQPRDKKLSKVLKAKENDEDSESEGSTHCTVYDMWDDPPPPSEFGRGPGGNFSGGDGAGAGIAV